MKQMTDWGFKNALFETWDFGHPGWLNERAAAYIVVAHSRESQVRSAGMDAFHQRRGYVGFNRGEIIPPQGPGCG